MRQLYLAQVFLSLDALKDGLVFFEQRPAGYSKLLPAEAVERERFAAKLAQAQLLLNADRYAAFAKLATTDIVPFLLQQNLPSLDSRSIAEIGSVRPLSPPGAFSFAFDG